jgi:hypothetical protein
MCGIWAGISEEAGVSAVAADFKIFVGGTNLPLQDRGDFGMTNQGASPAHMRFEYPQVVQEFSDIEMRSICSGVGVKTYGGFYGVLVKN